VSLALWLLAAARLWALLRLQILWRQILGPLWEPASAVLALVLAPLLAGGGGAEEGATMVVFSADWSVALLLELALGGVMGALASLPGHALLGAVAASGRELGLACGREGARSGALRAWTSLSVALVLAVGLASGLHQPLIEALRASAELWPVGAPNRWGPEISDPGVISATIFAAHDMTLLALALATPVLLSVAVVDLSSRAVGSGPMASGFLLEAMRPWFRLSLALLALGASWAAFPESWGAALS
jgi:flagellar biosynthesis protein FliR